MDLARRSAYDDIEAEVNRVKALAKRVRSEHEDMVETVVCSALTVVFGVATGIYQGRYGSKEYFGVKAEILAGAVLVAWGLWSDDDLGEYAVAAGTGILTVAAASWGAEKGIEWRKAALPGGGASPALPAAAGASMRLTDDQLDQMAHTAW